MDRRSFLAASLGVAATTAAAGCSTVGGTTTLSSPTERLDANGREKHLIYRHNDTQQAVVTIRQDGDQETPEDSFGLRFYVSHREGLSIDRMYFRIRAPPQSVQPPAEIYLKTPDGGPWPPIDFETDEDLWTVIEIDDIGELGDGTLGLETIVRPLSRPVEEVAVQSEVALSGGGALGTRYVAEGNTRFEPVSG